MRTIPDDMGSDDQSEYVVRSVKVPPQMLRALTNARLKLGEDQSTFIRRAIVERLKLASVQLDEKYQRLPDRQGKGGRPRGAYPPQIAQAFELNEDQTAAPPPESRKRKGSKLGGQP